MEVKSPREAQVVAGFLESAPDVPPAVADCAREYGEKDPEAFPLTMPELVTDAAIDAMSEARTAGYVPPERRQLAEECLVELGVLGQAGVTLTT